MSPLDLFNTVTEEGSYIVGYLVDGWTREIHLKARSPAEAMMVTQNFIGNICNVTYVERGMK